MVWFGLIWSFVSFKRWIRVFTISSKLIELNKEIYEYPIKPIPQTLISSIQPSGTVEFQYICILHMTCYKVISMMLHKTTIHTTTIQNIYIILLIVCMYLCNDHKIKTQLYFDGMKQKVKFYINPKKKMKKSFIRSRKFFTKEEQWCPFKIDKWWSLSPLFRGENF